MKKIKDTKHIHANTVLRVYKKGFGYSRFIVIENNDYYLAAITNTEMIDIVNDGDVVESYLWLEDDFSYDFELTVIGKISIGKKIVFFSHTNQLTSTQGRKCIGLGCKIPVEFFLFERGDESKTITSEEVFFYNGEIIWLEDREAVLKSKNSLPETFFKSHIVINNKEIEMLGRIQTLHPGKNIYNILYSGMHEKDRNHILDYIYNSYRE